CGSARAGDDIENTARHAAAAATPTRARVRPFMSLATLPLKSCIRCSYKAATYGCAPPLRAIDGFACVGHTPDSKSRRLLRRRITCRTTDHAKDRIMKTTRLGTTGLKVSRLALGCMSYGDASVEGAHAWALNDEAAQPFFQQAVELGLT